MRSKRFVFTAATAVAATLFVCADMARAQGRGPGGPMPGARNMSGGGQMQVGCTGGGQMQVGGSTQSGTTTQSALLSQLQKQQAAVKAAQVQAQKAAMLAQKAAMQAAAKAAQQQKAQIAAQNKPGLDKGSLVFDKGSSASKDSSVTKGSSTTKGSSPSKQ